MQRTNLKIKQTALVFFFLSSLNFYLKITPALALTPLEKAEQAKNQFEKEFIEESDGGYFFYKLFYEILHETTLNVISQTFEKINIERKNLFLKEILLKKSVQFLTTLYINYDVLMDAQTKDVVLYLAKENLQEKYTITDIAYVYNEFYDKNVFKEIANAIKSPLHQKYNYFGKEPAQKFLEFIHFLANKKVDIKNKFKQVRESTQSIKPFSTAEKRISTHFKPRLSNKDCEELRLEFEKKFASDENFRSFFHDLFYKPDRSLAQVIIESFKTAYPKLKLNTPQEIRETLTFLKTLYVYYKASKKGLKINGGFTSVTNNRHDKNKDFDSFILIYKVFYEKQIFRQILDRANLQEQNLFPKEFIEFLEFNATTHLEISKLHVYGTLKRQPGSQNESVNKKQKTTDLVN